MDKEYYEVFYNNNNIGDSNADSETLSEKTKAPSQKKEPNESHISKISIYDFLKLSIETGYWYKLGGMITNKQVVFQVARGDFDDHWSMEIKINKSVFPNRRYDAYNTYKDAIYVFGLGNSISIDLPNRVSFQQYQILLDIINQIKKFEKDYDKKIEYFDSDAILKEAQKKLIISYPIESDEIIVGKSIDEQIIINSLNSELKESIENCNDYLKLTNIARRISDFYEDGFYKKSILKLIPNAEKIYKINEKIRNNGMREHNNFLDLVSNIDVPSNNQFLQQLLMESKKEKTEPDKNDEVESLMVQIYEGATLKNEEDKMMNEIYKSLDEKKHEEEEKRYSKMYEQALKDNEEFDRKKEEVREYSEMYEQALKDNEEFDRRKEEKKHKSLLDKEAQLRQEWKDNKTEESYYNYKNSIKDRLEYENAKKLYENANNSNVLLSEIEKINKAKHFSDETKEELISEIESSKRVK